MIAVAGARAVAIAVNFGMIGYAARKLGPAAYGKFTYANVIVAYASVLLAPGIITWGTRRIARRDGDVSETVFSVNAAQLLLAVLAFLACLVLSEGIPDNDQRAAIRVCSATLFVSALSVDWVFSGLEINRRLAPIAVFSTVLSALMQLMLIHGADDLVLMCALAPTTSLVGSLVAYAVLSRSALVTVVIPNPRAALYALRASLSLTYSAMLVAVLHHVNTLLVEWLAGPEELGHFACSLRIFDACAMLTSLMISVFIPRLSRLVAENPIAARAEAHAFARSNILLGAFLGAGIFAEAPTIVVIIFGEHYLPATASMRPIGIAVLFTFAISGYTNALLAFRRDRVMIAVVGASACWAVLGGLTMVPAYGAAGAGIVYAGIDVVGWLVSLPAYREELGSILLNTWVRPIAGATLVIGTATLLKELNVVWPVRAVVESLSYWAITWPILKTLSQSITRRR